MSKKVNKKEFTLKTAFLTAAGILFVSSGEALRTGELLVGVILLLLGALAYGIHEVLSQRQFAFEGEFASLVQGFGGGEAIAEEAEEAVRENEDEIGNTLEETVDNVVDSSDDT